MSKLVFQSGWMIVNVIEYEVFIPKDVKIKGCLESKQPLNKYMRKSIVFQSGLQRGKNIPTRCRTMKVLLPFYRLPLCCENRK